MFFFVFLFLLLNSGQCDDRYRPQYHLLPASNWLNDPNGPIYYNGYYHMFFQYNPQAPVANKIHWGHCYSTDMIHWIRLPIALAPDQPYDINGVWTGSATIVNNTPIIIYTGINENNAQVQCQARPANISDPTLSQWIKWPSNPLITYPSGRDPSTAFQDDKNNYYLIYGFGTDQLGGQAVLFTSRDFVNWTYLHPIHSNHNDVFWECPDIFNVSNQIVLKASLRGQDFWAVGQLDPQAKVFHPLLGDLGEYTQLVDQGKFYASKTFFDPLSDQQVIVGWVAEDDDQGEKRGWQGMHSLPRSVFLSDDGLHIRTKPVETVRSLRDQISYQYFRNIILSSVLPFEILPNVNGNQMEILIDCQFPKHQDLDFGLSVLSTRDGSQRTSIGIMTLANTNMMLGWDIPGWDYFNVSGVTDASQCGIACDEEDKCISWTFVSTRQVNNNCFLKTGIPHLQLDPTCISGIKTGATVAKQLVWVYINRTLSQQNPGAAHYPVAGTFWLNSESLSEQWFLQLNVFIDHSIIEVFEPQQGRVAITTRVYPEDETAVNLGLYVNTAPTTNGNIIINNMDIWNLTTIWT